MAKSGDEFEHPVTNLLSMAVILRQYRDEVRRARPPAFVQHAVSGLSRSWGDASATAAGTRSTADEPMQRSSPIP